MTSGSLPPKLSIERLAAAGGAVAATRVFDLVASYLFYLLVAHAVSTSDFGRLVVALTVAQAAAVATRLGLDIAVMRRAAEAAAAAEERIGRVVGRAVAVAGLLSAAAVGAIAAGIFVVPQFAHYRGAFAGANRWVLFAIPVLAAAPIVIAALRGRGEIAHAAIAESVLQPSVALIMAAVALGGGGGAFASAALVVSTLATLIYALARLHRAGALRRGAAADGLIALGARVAALNALNALANAADVVVLARFANPALVALYAAALKLGRALVLTGEATLVAVGPAIPHLLRHQTSEHLGVAYRTIVRWNTLLTAPAALLFIAIPERILSLFGRGFAGGAPLLRILALTFAVFVFAGPVKSVLVMSGKERLLTRNAALHLAITTALLLALVPGYLATGAAAALLAATVIQRTLLVIHVGRGLGIQPIGARNAFVFLSFVSAAAASMLLLPFGRIIAAGASLLLFAIAAASSRFDAHDRDVVRGLLGIVRRPVRL